MRDANTGTKVVGLKSRTIEIAAADVMLWRLVLLQSLRDQCLRLMRGHNRCRHGAESC